FCSLVLDMEYRFLRFLFLRKEGSKRRLVIRLWKETKPRARPDLLSELVRLLDNRYLLAERVYFHHAKLVSGAMLADAAFRQKLDGKLKETDLWDMGDEQLLEDLVRSKGAVSRLSSAIRTRKLWKDVFEKDRHQIAKEQIAHRNTDVMSLTMEYWW